MSIEPAPSDREVLAGLVERVTYQNAENGFCVIRVKARGHRDLVTLVGYAATISAGEWITATGDWVNDRTHGRQFKARFLKTSTPTSNEGIEKYLASATDGWTIFGCQTLSRYSSVRRAAEGGADIRPDWDWDNIRESVTGVHFPKT